MIAVATNNGHALLAPLIASMERFGTDGHEVLVVDTHSTNPESLAYLDELTHYQGPLKLRVTQPVYKNGYEPGAYLHAFKNFPSERYLFLHDGMLAKSNEWVRQFESRVSEVTPIVPWIAFAPLMMGCHQGHFDFVINAFGPGSWPTHGIFGSIFYATRESLLQTERHGFLGDKALPRNKTGAEGMERGFAVAFHRAGIATNPVHQGIDLKRVHEDGYPHLRKIFVGRT